MSSGYPPNPPPHDGGHSNEANNYRESHHQYQNLAQAQPVRTINRTKTVKNNLGQAGNKVRGLFGKKQKDSDNGHNKVAGPREEPRSFSSGNSQRGWDRASIPSSFQEDPFDRPVSQAMSYYGERSGGPADNNNVRLEDNSTEHRPSSSVLDMSATATATTDDVRSMELPSLLDEIQQNYNLEDLSPEAQELVRELQQVNHNIAQMQKEVMTEAEKRQNLQFKLEEAKRQVQAQEQEYAQIEHKFFDHTRSIRATDDDLSTIRDAFKLLKYSIARLIMTLNKKADKQTATEKFASMWPHLGVTELEPSHVNLLAEKLVHEHLVQQIFRCPLYPGLEINDAYESVTQWLTAHNSEFPVRLRQQLAAIVAKSGKDSELYLASQAEKKKVIDLIYNDLAGVYEPFIRENDANVDEEKRYYAKVTDIVDKAMKLAIAMRGQEVDISTLDTKEGEEEFDEQTMIDVKGKTSGIVRFCICPAFVGGDGEHGFLEKGKVVIA
ncbi:hypothetical protein BDC45DRAFT_530312 [Circinella umbellata]|nr:hypothetical protein BDC45DRAFT_530312 [Circinella umbellata]